MKKYIIALLIVLGLNSCNAHPKITKSDIEKDIIGHNIGGMFGWTFGRNEPRKIFLVTQKQDGDRAYVIACIETHSYSISVSLGSASLKRNKDHYMSGDVKLNYEWINNRWYLTDIKNLSFSRGKGKCSKYYK